MSASLTRLHGGRAITWRTVLGLLLVPLTAAGVLLWGLWNPSDRLGTITAAVVNHDEPVTVDGQLTPLGRVVAGELIGGDEAGFTWVLTDEEDGSAGIDDGRYAAVVTIPENFSAAATSFARGPAEAETATIELQTSDRGRLLDSALSSIVMNTATTVLNDQLGSNFVGGIFVGMAELGAGIGEAAAGASALADGLTQLTGGADALAGGTAELSNGVQQLSGGASELAAGARQAAVGGAQLAAGVEAYTGGINQALGGLQAMTPEVTAQLQALRVLIADPATQLPDGVDRAALLARFDALIGRVGGLDQQLGQLITGGTELATGARASADGQAQLASGLEGYAAGMASLAAGTPALANGAAELAAGTRGAGAGAGELADGLHSAAAAIPNYTAEERQRLGETAVQPVRAEGASDELFSAAGVPLFVGIALWAGAFASYLVLAPLWRRTREAARGVARITLRSALPAVAIGAAQGALAGLLLPPFLGYDTVQWLGFLGLSVLAGISFSLVNQGLSALLGGFGRFLAFALLVVAFAIGVVSTAPPVLRAIGDASPIGALFSGFQAIAMGVSGGGAAAGILALWGVGGLILTAFAVRRARRQAP